ncbi:hypothetical protein SELMODRAFT_121667 [Selaginella moellendorffii]|uniref:Enoyl reductase (ER) domain-containing protein n=1 Tax=Selaginella moellendorffii TaxID=88036 RepID=D8SPK3_SELML|nr:reticulon-4-interacting protein 1 homolog, mitochondrial [Selaginella moellendorffii]XP_024514849.1 reticulon-4-interacting protein 1 homolog, mitochondrial [Selaginella moellendorffii]EFJ13796.1 hypothetical protein SELMODRAFT_121667 [Selaginella moellendorffii]|eukprot:XP_002985302.1 reticulon-4-interacting protein 1 homolog, mitochondrial [Selaginella moellendorffii]
MRRWLASPYCRGHSRSISTCRAVVLPRFGGPEVLELRKDVPVPHLEAEEVLVRTVAAGVNPLDIKMREGYGRSLFQPLLPIVLGRDVSGEIVAIGNGVKRLHVGQHVFGALHPTAVRGTYSDYAILQEEQLALKPKSLTHVEAAAIPFAALTAWRALWSTARMKSGQKVLIMGGGGAVGLAAIQLARAAGCSVAATCGKRSCSRVGEAGAELIVDYTSENTREQLTWRFDAVLDTIGVETTEALGVNVLKRGGHYMTLQGEAVKLADKYGLIVGGGIATATLLRKRMQYTQSHGIDYSWIIMRTDAEGLEQIARLAKEGRLKIPVGETFSLDEAAKAQTVRENKDSQGKVVLQVQQE